MKNSILKMLAMMLCAVMITACGGGTSVEETTVLAETSAVSEIAEIEKDTHTQMVERSLVSMGNSSRVKKKLLQMKSGEETTVAYIGGSITQGMNAGSEGCYAKLSYNYLAENYGTGDNVKYVNAGIAGTPSVLGNLRLERDVLSHKPDIVFIEFAVNDAQDLIHKESYESMVKTILSQDNEPAVILLFTILETGYTCQEHMSAIGERYDLPMISVGDALTPEFNEGRMVWDDYSNDGSHPHAEGHKLVTEFIVNYFEKLAADEAVPDSYEIPKAPLNGWSYENASLAEAGNISDLDGIELIETGGFSSENGTSVAFFNNGWKYTGEGGAMKLKITANAVFIVYKQANSDEMGSLEVYRDGSKAYTINANDPDGWNNPCAVQVIKRSAVPEMEIELKMADGSEGKQFEILAIGYSQNEPFTF